MAGIWDQVLETIGILRGVIGLLKDAKDILPAAKREVIELAIAKAETASNEAEIKLVDRR